MYIIYICIYIFIYTYIYMYRSLTCLAEGRAVSEMGHLLKGQVPPDQVSCEPSEDWTFQAGTACLTSPASVIIVEHGPFPKRRSSC